MSQRMTRVESRRAPTGVELPVRFKRGHGIVTPWRGHADIAHLVLDSVTAATSDDIRRGVEQLRAAGYHSVITSAMTHAGTLAFLDAGFEVRERLHLLEHRLDDLPARRGPRLHRARRRDHPPVVALDARSFDAFWRLDALGLRDALHATPSVRFRVARGRHPSIRHHDVAHHVTAYAITGWAGPHGYLQRIAVAPELRGCGLGRALVFDALRWLTRVDTRRALVNTQIGNDAALALYESCGFRRLVAGLYVLGRTL